MSVVVKKACWVGYDIAVQHRIVAEVWASHRGWSILFPANVGYAMRRRAAEDKGHAHVVTFKPKPRG